VNVTRMPLSRERLTDIIREIGKDSERWPVAISYEKWQLWRHIVNRRQIELCLLEGWILQDKVTPDENGYWCFQVTRVCSGFNVVIEVALEPDRANRKLIVTGISGDRIEV
jgi:hypothetical protein